LKLRQSKFWYFQHGRQDLSGALFLAIMLWALPRIDAEPMRRRIRTAEPDVERFGRLWPDSGGGGMEW
jgi:hypothetical protein